MTEFHRTRMDIAEDPAFQRRIWRLQRLAWITMAGIVIAGFFGAFGGAGPLNRTTTGSGNLVIEYERFPAKLGPTKIRISLGSANGSDRRVVWLNQEYLDRMKLGEIQPEPVRSEATGGGIHFEFATDGPGPAHLSFSLTPMAAGFAQASIRIDGSGAVTVKQFVYP